VTARRGAARRPGIGGGVAGGQVPRARRSRDPQRRVWPTAAASPPSPRTRSDRNDGHDPLWCARPCRACARHQWPQSRTARRHGQCSLMAARRGRGRPPRSVLRTLSVCHPTPTRACGGGRGGHLPDRDSTVPITFFAPLPPVTSPHLAINPSLILPLFHRRRCPTGPPAQLHSVLQGGAFPRIAAAAHKAFHDYRRVVASVRRATDTAGPLASKQTNKSDLLRSLQENGNEFLNTCQFHKYTKI